MYQTLLEDTKKSLKLLVDQSGFSKQQIVRSLLGASERSSSFHLSDNGFSNFDQGKDLGEELRNHWLYSRKLSQNQNSNPNCEAVQDGSHQNCGESEECLLKKILDLLCRATCSVNKTAGAIIQNVVEQMVTKKIYKIRQNFRQLILDLLGIDEFIFYAHHQNGRVEFQDFSSNFITEIIEGEPKYQLVVSKQQSNQLFEFIDLENNSDWSKLFELNHSDISNCLGIALRKGSPKEQNSINYFLMVKAQNIELVKNNFEVKLLKKIIQICEINISDGSQFMISKKYAIKMLDLLEFFILRFELQLKKSLISLCKMGREKYCSVDSIVKIALSKVDQNLQNEQLVLKIRKTAEQLQETQYRKVQEVRLYKKYLRQNGVTLLEFNRVGVLLFLSGNQENTYLNSLSKIWKEGKPVLDSIFGDNKVLDEQIKKAIKGTFNSERAFEIQNFVKAKILTKGRRIQKIQIFIEEQEGSLPNNSTENSNTQTISSQLDRSEKIVNILKQLQSENPGIKNEGWIDLFLKNPVKSNIRRSISMVGKENFSVNIGGHERSANKIVRISSCTVPKEIYQSLDGISVDNPNLNFLVFSDIELESFAIKLFESLDYFQRMPQQRNKLQNFISQLHDNYEIHSNSFHNFKHGINVMHSCYLLSSLPSNFNILNSKNIFTNVFSGLCHDVGHTGFTNAFEIASMSRKAILYNDKSPLENYHASLTFELLRKEQNNFLQSMSRDEFMSFRKGVIENILFTDIKEHFPLLNRFNDHVKSGKKFTQEEVPLISAMIVHSADFAGSVKSFDICKDWALRVNQEFAKQYEVEGQIGLMQTPFMKDVNTPLVLSKAEGGFLKVIVYPLYQALDLFYVSESYIHKTKKNIENNIKNWEEMFENETKKKMKLQNQ